MSDHCHIDLSQPETRQLAQVPVVNLAFNWNTTGTPRRAYSHWHSQALPVGPVSA